MRRGGYEGSRDFFGYRGTVYEADLLDTPKTKDEKFAAAVKDIVHWSNGRRVVEFPDAFAVAEKFQPGDPTNPRKDFMKELRLAFADELGLETDEDLDRLEAYTAVGTPLDKAGIDGYFVIRDEKGGVDNIITFDLTMREDIASKVSASDVILSSELPDPSEDSAGYLDKIEGYAKMLKAEKEGLTAFKRGRYRRGEEIYLDTPNSMH